MRKKIEKQEIVCGKFIDSNNKCLHNIFKLYWKKGHIFISLVEKVEDQIVIAECQKCKGFLPIEIKMNLSLNIRNGYGGEVEYVKGEESETE